MSSSPTEIFFDGGKYRGKVNEQGQFHGYGVAQYISGDVYEGEFSDDLFHGRGCYKWADGDKYEGDYYEDQQHGYGTLSDITGTYTGTWVYDKRHGYGKQTFAGNGEIYEGEWYDDKRHGYGRVTQKAGSENSASSASVQQQQQRQAEIARQREKLMMNNADSRDINEALALADQTTTGFFGGQSFYEGGWMNNSYHGRGMSKNPDGDQYEGEFQRGKPHGQGIYEWATGITYLGTFIDGKKHGEGREKLPGGSWLQGRWVAGMADRSVLASKVDPDEMEHFEREFRRKFGFTPKVVTNPAKKEFEERHQAEHQPGGFHYDSNLSLESEGSDLSTQPGTVNNKNNNNNNNGNSRSTTPSGGQNNNNHQGQQQQQQQISSARGNQNQNQINNNNQNSQSMSLSSSSQLKSINTYPGDAGEFNGSTTTNGLGATTRSGPTVTEAELEGYMISKLLGKGSFGSVFEALLPCGKQVCVKQIELGNINSPDELKNLMNEINLMKRLHHPNIVEYFGCKNDNEKNILYIFMELVTGGTVNHFVKRLKTVPLDTVRSWTKQTLLGVQYLHKEGIIHRDIKGDNILVSNGSVVKLADFGCSKQIDDVCSRTRGCNTMVGTPYWMAPEVIKCEADTGYGAKSDIWSIGCTVVEMITGRPPWPESDSMWAAVFKIANSTGLPPGIPENLPKEVMEFLAKCFERDPKKRATADELLQTPWIVSGISK